MKQRGHHAYRCLRDRAALADKFRFLDLATLNAQLQSNLITTNRVRHMDLNRCPFQFTLVPRVTVMLKDQLLIERAELGCFH